MKKTVLIVLMLAAMISCSRKVDKQPLTGTRWGEIANPSAEAVRSSEVISWTADHGRQNAVHIFDHVAREGSKSLTISATQPSHGRWYTRVNVKPWTTYEFIGWIKTENLKNTEGEGAGFHLAAFWRPFEYSTESVYFTGTTDWTKVTIEFHTGDQDCLVLECLFSRNGKSTGQAWFDHMSLKELKSDILSPDIRIDLAKEQEEMPEYIYGQFIEHLGRCIYGGIWAEMLEDRKFFFPPNHRESAWKVHPESALELDSEQSYVGDITPVLLTRGRQTAQLIQDGIGTRTGMSCSGRIILKAEGISMVNVSLCWGEEQTAKDMVSIMNPSDQYKTYNLVFDEVEGSENASLIIEAIGNGKLWVGTVSLMPDDHADGFRKDVLTLLKELDAPVYRWPGGNFVSGYDWKDGIGDPDKRPPRKNPAWTGVEHNDVGIHEFMRFCELLETEPYIAVNAGLGGVEEARKQIEYCNGDESTPMGSRRASNGRQNPWKVRWWGIGNEMYGGWQLGHMSTEAYVEKHNEFARAMKSVDPDILLVAVGDVGPWDEMILTHSADHMDYISEHFYLQDWHGGGLMTHIRQIPYAIKGKATAHRTYRSEIPSLQGKDIRICMDEWNYWYGPHVYGELGTRYFMRDALGIAAGLNEFSRHTDIIYMANYAQTVNVIGAIKATDNHAAMAATGQALAMYRAWFGTIPVEVSGDQRPLDIAATLTPDRRYLTVSMVNLSWDSWEVPILFEGSETISETEVIILEAASDMAYNVPGQPEQVRIQGPETRPFTGKVSVGPLEAAIFRFPLKD